MEHRKSATRRAPQNENHIVIADNKEKPRTTQKRQKRSRQSSGSGIVGIFVLVGGFVILGTQLVIPFYLFSSQSTNNNNNNKNDNNNKNNNNENNKLQKNRSLRNDGKNNNNNNVYEPPNPDDTNKEDLIKSLYFPRVVGCYFGNVSRSSYIGTEALPANIIPLYSSHAMPDVTSHDIKRQAKLQDSKAYRRGAADQWEKYGCEAQYDWQKMSYPTCNVVHEHDLLNLQPSPHELEKLRLRQEQNERYKYPKVPVKLMSHGYWRDVWKYESPTLFGQSEMSVVKTIRYEHDMVPRNYERHRRDAMAMERLTKYKAVMNIYGYCGNSGVFEFGDGGSLEDAIWEREEKYTTEQKLIIAYQVALGVSNTHNFDMMGRASIAHTDITASQFVYVSADGIFKLNDFNRARFITIDKKHNITCPFEIGNNPGSFRSPEEYKYQPETEKVDVYSMGNVLYSILTEKWPFESDSSDKKAQRKIKRGERPELPDPKRVDAYSRALIKVIKECWKQEPKDRISSHGALQMIISSLEELKVVSEDAGKAKKQAVA